MPSAMSGSRLRARPPGAWPTTRTRSAPISTRCFRPLGESHSCGRGPCRRADSCPRPIGELTFLGVRRDGRFKTVVRDHLRPSTSDADGGRRGTWGNPGSLADQMARSARVVTRWAAGPRRGRGRKPRRCRRQRRSSAVARPDSVRAATTLRRRLSSLGGLGRVLSVSMFVIGRAHGKRYRLIGIESRPRDGRGSAGAGSRA